MDLVAVTERDADQVIAMLKKSFFPNEPLNASIGLVDAAGGCPELEAYCRHVVPSGLSLRAVETSSGDLMGVILNDVIERPTASESEGARTDGHLAHLRPDATKFDKILAVNFAAELAADVFGVYPDEDSILDVKILATHPAHTRRGVAGALVEETLSLARARGLRVVRCVCSGAFSARAAQAAGFTKLAELHYDSFLGADGRPVFRPDAPHTAITTWARTV